jgi:putative resolvase
MDKSLMQIGQAAKLLNVSAKTLRRWHSSGDLMPSVITQSGRRFYRMTELEIFINAKTKGMAQR